MPDYYKMTPAELAAELEKAYKEAMKKVHPDTKRTPEEQEKATRLAAKINVLRDQALAIIQRAAR